jgi:DNA-binding protein
MPEEQAKEQVKLEDNVVYVGQKPSMAYVLAVITQFSNSQNEIHLKARGRAISRAVDVAEIVRRKFLQDVHLKDIQIGTEEKEVEGQGKLNISTIDITLAK